MFVLLGCLVFVVCLSCVCLYRVLCGVVVGVSCLCLVSCGVLCLSYRVLCGVVVAIGVAWRGVSWRVLPCVLWCLVFAFLSYRLSSVCLVFVLCLSCCVVLCVSCVCLIVPCVVLSCRVVSCVIPCNRRYSVLPSHTRSCTPRTGTCSRSTKHHRVNIYDISIMRESRVKG